MKISLVSIAFVLVLTCRDNQKSSNIREQKVTIVENAITNNEDFELEVYDFNGLEKFLHNKDDKTYVVNFWATWCKPCVKELPSFEKLNTKFSDKNVEVILISLDFPHQYDTKLKPFIKEKNITSKVVVLDDVDMDTWIPKVSENWSGAIPATLIYRNDSRKFYEQSFTYDELETEVKHFIN